MQFISQILNTRIYPEELAGENVRHLKDIEAVDADFQKAKEQRAVSREKSVKVNRPNKFNNFSGRSYDMDDLERRLIQQ